MKKRKIREALSDTLIVVGLGGITAGAALFLPALGFLVGGLCCAGLGWLLAAGGERG